MPYLVSFAFSLKLFEERQFERQRQMEEEGMVFRIYYMFPNQEPTKYVNTVEKHKVKVNSKASMLTLGSKESNITR